MRRANFISALVINIAMLAVAACTTPAQMHTDEQLNRIALGCGLALGDLMQDDREKRLLLMMHQNPSAEQRLCVVKWARKNGLSTVFVNVQFPEG